MAQNICKELRILQVLIQYVE